MSPIDADCPSQEAWSAFVDREAGPAESSALRLHLERCGGCSDRVRSLRACKAALRASPVATMPAELRESLERLAAALKPPARPRKIGPWESLSRAVRMALRPAMLVPAAAAAAALIATSWPRRPGRPAARIDVPVELVLAAHDRYALTLPLTPPEQFDPEPQARLADGSMERRDAD